MTLAFGYAGASPGFGSPAGATGGRAGGRAPPPGPTPEQVAGAARAMLEDSGVLDLEHQVGEGLVLLHTHAEPGTARTCTCHAAQATPTPHDRSAVGEATGTPAAPLVVLEHPERAGGAAQAFAF